MTSCITMLLMLGCQQLERENQVMPRNLLTASLEREASTKAHMGEPVDNIYYPYWTSGDQLAVYVNDISVPDKYELISGADTDKGTFAGIVSGSDYVALYPFSSHSDKGLKDGILHLTLPEEQIYAENSFGEGAFPMVAVSKGQSLSFLNLCSVLKVSMTGTAAVQAIHFMANDMSMSVCGPASVRTDYTSVPELIMDAGGPYRVTLRCISVALDEKNPTDFFLVIPPGTYKGGFTLEVDTFSGTFVKSITSDVTFARSQFRYIAPIECITDGEIDPDNIPHNQIWYKSSIPNHFYQWGTDRNHITTINKKDGMMVAVYDGPITYVNGSGNSDIIEIHLPNSVETIDGAAFERTSIETFRTPDNLKVVKNNWYGESNRYSNLKRIYGEWASSDEKAIILEDGYLVMYALGAIDGELLIPNETITIGPRVFYNSSTIRKVIIPEGVKAIEEGAFTGCSALETVVLPNSLESLPKSTTSLPINPFADCPELQSFEGNKTLSPDGHAFIYGSWLLCLAGKNITDYTLPENVSIIRSRALSQCKQLKSLTFIKDFPKNTAFDVLVFEGCDQLEFLYGSSNMISEDHHCLVVWGNALGAITPICPSSYTIPDNMGILELLPFFAYNNVSIEQLTLPDPIHTVRDYAFSDMPNLRTLRLSAGLTTMGTILRCPKLDTVYFRGTTPPTTYSESEDGYWGHEGLVIYVPEGSENAYKSSADWSKYAEYIQGYKYDDESPDYYVSKDYSRDGKVTVLQKASQGSGIDIVLMGDAFSDRQIEDGYYSAVMKKIMEALFSEEPYKSYRNLFNVYEVSVVSRTEGYEHVGQALGGYFGNGTKVGGNDTQCINYARKAIPDELMDNALIVVAMNSPNYGGTCYLYDPSSLSSDYGCGTSVAYFPIGESDESLARLVLHEAGGHGFAKLADEYFYEETGSIPETAVIQYQDRFVLGWWKNADFTNSPHQVKWAKFLADDRYQYDGLGIFEGAFTYKYGVWRPTEFSIMRYNEGGYNAPSREAIWYRIHKLAYGDSWEYDYEKFVEYDTINRKASVYGGTWAPRNLLPKTQPPVVVGKTWRDAVLEISCSED